MQADSKYDMGKHLHRATMRAERSCSGTVSSVGHAILSVGEGAAKAS